MSLKCLSRLLYMEPRESGPYSVPSSLSTPRKNLAIILSRSLRGICPGALSSPIEVKKSVITFMSLFVFVLVFLFKFSSKKKHQFLRLLPYETFCLVRHFLSDCRNPRSGLLTNLWVSSADQVQRTRNLGFRFQIYSLIYHLLPFLTDRCI